MISADQIRSSFYGSSSILDRDCQLSFGQTPRTKADSGPAASISGTVPTTDIFGAGCAIDLTPTSRHILRLLRRRLVGPGGESRTSLIEADLRQLVMEIENAENEFLSELERTSVIAALESSLDDFDILTPLIENPRVNDIIARSFDDISIQIDRRNVQTDYRFPDTEAYRSFVENLLKRVGKSCTTSTPVVDAAVGSNIRLCVTHESFSPAGSGPMMTIRIARHSAVSLSALNAAELAPQILLEYLEILVRDCGATLLVSGEVGTGKTTLIRALAMAIDSAESILIIEDTHEIVLQRPFVRTLLTREANTEGAGRIEPAAAIRTGMRMAMNRLILGEMRDAKAAESFIDVCSSGHSGMSTIHARSARDSLVRLELFLGRAQGLAGSDTIRKEIANAVSVVVHLGVDRVHGKRRIIEILEIASFSDGAIQHIPIFSISSNDSGCEPRWQRGGGVSQFDVALRRSGVELPAVGAVVNV